MRSPMKKRRRIPRVEPLEARHLPSASMLGSVVPVDQPFIVPASGVNHPGMSATSDDGRIVQLTNQQGQAETGPAGAADQIALGEASAENASPPRVTDTVFSDQEAPIGLFETAANDLSRSGLLLAVG